ncbi:hypothetical protein XCCB100_1062 [Xanthomonas campestris pv. campestris]|uniref:Uncharacterized protein n=2 Tax=Xanthomonas campestris TaxID=339 RepID=B0RPM5_XANCB|nr:hypothetical protein XCCB100_1062 [Xanthomonas campestris pv. campestris]
MIGMSRTPIQDLIDAYKSQGYEELDLAGRNPFGGSGARVILNRRKRRAIKFNQDPAYDQFVDWALKNPSDKLPEIFRVIEHLCSMFGVPSFTEVEMELLEDLSDQEVEQITPWVEVNRKLPSFDGSADPFCLNDTMKSVAKMAADSGYALDIKDSNFLARETDSVRTIVVTDPLGNA